MESFGRALVLEPFFATVVLGGTLVSQAGTPEQKAAILPKVAAGELLLAFAYAEPGTRWSQTDIGSIAVRAGDSDAAGWRVSGEKIAVLGADSADTLIVSAVTADGIGLFLVDAGSASVDAYPLQDGQRGGDVLLDNAPAQLLGTSPDALDHISTVIDIATAALCNAMRRALVVSVCYFDNTSPNRAHVLPSNFASCTCSIGKKSVALVLILIPGSSIGRSRSLMLAACFITFSRVRSLPHCFSTCTNVIAAL